MPGNTIADFEVPATGNQRFASAAFRGHPYVIYFYPKDDTPGCTIQGKSFTATKDAFDAAGVKVIGVSADDVTSHRNFSHKFAFTIELLSDTESK